MSDENRISKLALEAVPKLFNLLSPLSAEERQRAIKATLILFGQPETHSKVDTHQEQMEPSGGISGKAIVWMKKNSISRDQLEHVFSIEDDSVDVIAARMPASGKRQQTVQAYVICGLKTFLKTGDPAFTDSEARELCSKVGCYDVANHSNYRKAFGNLLNGSKDSGWKLTNPGLSEAVKIVKSLTPEAVA